MFLTINDIKDIAAKMVEAMKIDYSNFNFSFFRRRLTYCFDKLNVHKVTEFNDMLSDATKSDAIAYYMSVPATEMFRDPAFWRALRKRISTHSASLRVWFPDVVDSKELFSLLIILEELGLRQKVSVVVNSVSQIAIDEIKSLVISNADDEVNRSNFERLEVDAQYDDYIEKNESQNQIKLKAELLSKVEFRKCWFMNESFDKFDIVIFRNNLLNYNNQMHEKVMNRLTAMLDSKGLLAIGIKEVPVIRTTMFGPIEANESIYGRLN